MSLAAESAIRRHERYRVVAPHEVRVVARSQSSDGEPVLGQLLDLSDGGARVRLSEPLKFNEAIGLRLECDAIDVGVEVAATVCWIRPGEDDDWVLGCAFDPELPEEYVRGYFEEGVLERRQSGRTPVGRKGQARWELRQETVDVELVDVSEGGFCLRAPAGIESGRVAVRVEAGEETIVLNGRVQWRLEVEDGSLVGLQHLDGVDPCEIRRFTSGAGAADPAPASPRRRGIGASVYWVALLALAVCGGALAWKLFG